MKEHTQKELVYPYTTEEGEKMVEVHVDLLSQSLRKKLSTKLKIHGIEFCMGGNLSVRFPRGKTPIIKVGTDEIIFKVHTFTFVLSLVLSLTYDVPTHMHGTRCTR